MHTLVIGKFYSEGFALHIAETLADMGHQVERFEPGIKSGRAKTLFGKRLEQVRAALFSTTDNLQYFRRKRARTLWRNVESNQFDVALVCHDFLWPDEVARLKEHVGAVALWFPDHLGVFGKGYFMNAPYDALFFKDPYLVRVLSDVLDSSVYYLPECCNPAKHTLPIESPIPSEFRCELTTAGNQHPYRSAFLKHLTQYDLKIWGNPAPLWLNSPWTDRAFQGRPVHNHDKVRAFRGAKIVINNLHYGEIEGVNVRAFEAASSAAFQMVDWRLGLGQLFRDGEELVSFKNMRHLKQLIDYYLPRDSERDQIRQAGFQRVMREHTYRLRLELLLETINQRAAGYPMPERP